MKSACFEHMWSVHTTKSSSLVPKTINPVWVILWVRKLAMQSHKNILRSKTHVRNNSQQKRIGGRRMPSACKCNKQIHTIDPRHPRQESPPFEIHEGSMISPSAPSFVADVSVTLRM